MNYCIFYVYGWNDLSYVRYIFMNENSRSIVRRATDDRWLMGEIPVKIGNFKTREIGFV